MSLNPKHAEIMQTAPPLNPPGVKTSVPRVDTPTCEKDCSGRHEVDGVIKCGVCGGEKYAVILHEWKHSSGHYFTLLQPMNGAKPRERDEDLTCCSRPMRRIWR